MNHHTPARLACKTLVVLAMTFPWLSFADTTTSNDLDQSALPQVLEADESSLNMPAANELDSVDGTGRPLHLQPDDSDEIRSVDGTGRRLESPQGIESVDGTGRALEVQPDIANAVESVDGTGRLRARTESIESVDGTGVIHSDVATPQLSEGVE